MSSENVRQATGETTMLQAVLLDRVRETKGGQLGYARHLGVSSKSVIGWLNQGVNPLHRADTRDKVTGDLDLRPDELVALSEVSVREACDIVLQAKAAEDPAEQDLQDRFFGLMVEHGTAIPSAAFLIYMTGDQANRQRLVDLLETQGVTPHDPASESLQQGLDMLPALPGVDPPQ